MRFTLLSATLLLLAQAFAQRPLPLSAEYRQAIEKGTRTHTGQPGPKYWLNHAQYDIRVQFDPQTKTLVGSERILYTNNSPDTLTALVLAVYQDLMRRDNPRDWPFPVEKLNDGVSIGRLRVAQADIDLNNRKTYQHEGTNRILIPQKPILPGSQTEIEVEWTYTMAPDFNVRGGSYSNDRFFMNYFYPKIAVYDDIAGWDDLPYTGMAEMYSDFADYRLQITVPDEYKVWATGELKNASKLLAKPILKRFEAAAKADTTVRIIAPADLDNNDLILGSGPATWVFEAKYVPDVAFALGKRILWDAISLVRDTKTGQRLLLQAAYDPASTDFYQMTNIAARAIIDMRDSSVRWPFPYPQYTVFNGAGGMEYPMMCNNASEEEPRHASGLAYHEIAHTYFPFLMGTNERKYAWMDEGWARMFPTEYQDAHFDHYYTPYTKNTYLVSAGHEHELPPMTITHQNKLHQWYRQATYNKPHYAYLALRRYLGKDTFYKGLNHYMHTWNGKHPLPFDFFACFNQATGQNLDWFWRNWFFDRNYPDLRLVVENQQLMVENIGGLYVDAQLLITATDGSQKTIYLRADRWIEGTKLAVAPVADIRQAELTGPDLLDVTPADNTWKR